MGSLTGVEDRLKSHAHRQMVYDRYEEYIDSQNSSDGPIELEETPVDIEVAKLTAIDAYVRIQNTKG